ncbi:MAG: hypothetical protein AB8B91_09815 [Rubripirellula sp.]
MLHDAESAKSEQPFVSVECSLQQFVLLLQQPEDAWSSNPNNTVC